LLFFKDFYEGWRVEAGGTEALAKLVHPDRYPSRLALFLLVWRVRDGGGKRV
jgi:hypothetical protein